MGILQPQSLISQGWARRLRFLKKAQAVIWPSVLIFWSITVTVVKTDHIITIMKKKNPLIPSDYWPQNSHLHTVLDHKLWFTHIQHIHEWAVTVCTKLKSVAYAACGRTKITMCHCSSASDTWTPLLLSCGKWTTSPFYGEEVKDVVEGSTNPAIHPLLLQNYKFMSE